MSEQNAEANKPIGIEDPLRPKDEMKKTQPMAIEIDNRGLVSAKNNSELMRYCGAMIDSKMVPDRFKTPGELFGAIMFTRSLNLPDVAIRQVANIKGSPALFGDLPLSLVQVSGELKKFKEQWFDETYKVINFENKNLDARVFGAVCFMARGDGEVQSFSFTMYDATDSGLYPDKNLDKPWMKYTKLMLRYKARSIALKSLFADKINGVAIAEYDFDEIPEYKIKTVGGESANKANEAFKDDDQLGNNNEEQQ